MMGNTKEVFLSIVVPTRERYRTLSVLVERVLKWQRDDFELIVQDNSVDNSAFVALLERYSANTRLRYFHEPTPMSAPENCDLAVSQALGHVVTFIGDDDAVSPYAIDVAHWMVKHNIDAVVAPTAQYTWPGSKHAAAINNRFNGRLVLPKFDGSVSLIDHRKELLQMAQNGGGRIWSIPRLYHGLVRRERLQQLKSEVGTYFPGPIPDMPNAVGLSPFLEKVAKISAPIIVSGQSAQSMSGQNAIRKHQGEIGSNAALPKDTEQNWDARVPRYWSGPNIWAEGVLKGAGRTGQKDVLEAFDFNWVYARDFVYTKAHYYPRIFSAMKHDGTLSLIARMPVIAVRIVTLVAERARVYFGKMRKRNISNPEFEDISEVLDFFEADAQIAATVKKTISAPPQ